MKVTSAEFLKSAFQAADWPHGNQPEIAFMGRSNVGKSSLINSLLGVRGLARASKTPGRTQSINFFTVNDKFRFVDLPGYGYAKVPEKVRRSWGEMARDYLANRLGLVLSIHIVDSRHKPAELDLQLHEWLDHHQKPYIIVATKSDKLSQNELHKNLARCQTELGTDRVLTYSATTGRGREAIWQTIESSLKRFQNFN